MDLVSLDFFTIYFFFTSLVLIFCSFNVVFAKNPIDSLLSLVVCFISTTFYLIILKVEFLALIFIIIYVGAIAVLFLFCIMMVNIKLMEVQDSFLRYLPVSIVIIFIFFLEIFLISLSFFGEGYKLSNLSSEYLSNQYYNDWVNFFFSSDKTNILILGEYLYTYGFVWFFLSSFILLVSMVGSIILTLHNRYGLRRQIFFNQFSRSYSKNIKFYS
jgi:NADH-quinone oxidoreductase subunit J